MAARYKTTHKRKGEAMHKLNQWGSRDELHADIVVDGEIWCIGPNNYCQLICKVSLFWEVHFYTDKSGITSRVARWFVRNAASDEQ